VLDAFAASTGATDVPVAYRTLARAAAARALAAGQLPEPAAAALLDVLASRTSQPGPGVAGTDDGAGWLQQEDGHDEDGPAGQEDA
jgi:hypothetical protein